ncbi:hypothetical protein [Streptomyces sp. ML-6]|uniref:hypothetical protein n=1 Tax=unclassified Streptomyces TaxID=2593676 RepID=UPI0024C0A2E5|nr:hypothetical protein [Streptomyces sp. ML-6]MDK0523922.1 hypothetical protein [Streptomyces sp. ML-6]
MTNAPPPVHGLLDEAVRLLSQAVEELGAVAEENLDAPACTAGTFGRVRSRASALSHDAQFMTAHQLNGVPERDRHGFQDHGVLHAP